VTGDRPSGSKALEAASDAGFFKRADAHIDVANAQLEDTSRGKVSASMMYATARFNAWVTACTADSDDEMRGHREETIEYFVTQYRKMLEENLDDYIANFAKYMSPKEGGA
jgi:hypothetical protein